MDTSSFTIPIEVLANNVATITLTYQEVLRRQKGVYDIWIIVGHCGNGYNTHVKLSITETKPLTKLKVVPYWERPMQGNYQIIYFFISLFINFSLIFFQFYFLNFF